MSAIVQGAKKLLGRAPSGVGARLEELQRAVDCSRGRLPDDLVDEADAIAQRASQRLLLSGEHTVVALAGATGSGKSSTFNAVTDMDLAAVGVRRPTTSWTMSCVWGSEGAGQLLDWLGVPARHQVSRDSMLDQPQESRGFDGLVLLDLPDHDSTELTHHVEVERLVKLADLLVWVLDPQKYADAAIHDRFLRPLATHKDIMLVVLNHIDEVAPERRASMVTDLKRLLEQDGLSGVPVLTTSATLGDGIPELKRAIASRVSAKQATNARLRADIATVATRMSEVTGTTRPGDVARQRKAELVDAFAEAAGVPVVVRAVEKAAKQRAGQATGWPLTKWLSRLKPDPLRRLHLDTRTSGQDVRRARASLPKASPVQRARVDTAVRSVADSVAAELSPPWAEAVRRASTSRLPDLNDALDQAVSGTDLGVSRLPWWWQVVRVVQVLLFLAALAGGVWLLVLAVLAYLQIHVGAAPDASGLPLPTLLLVGGVALGLVIAAVCRALAGVSARAKARSAEQRLRAAISEVTEQLVVEPIETEVDAYRTARQALTAVLR